MNKINKKNLKKVITYNLKFIDSAKHMNSALSTLVDNLSEINKCNCKERKYKDIKTKILKGTGKTIIRTTCKTCKSKQDQLLNTLIEISLVHTNYVIKILKSSYYY